MNAYKTISKKDLENWVPYQLDYLLDILTGEYLLENAREDILSFRNPAEQTVEKKQ